MSGTFEGLSGNKFCKAFGPIFDIEISLLKNNLTKGPAVACHSGPEHYHTRLALNNIYVCIFLAWDLTGRRDSCTAWFGQYGSLYHFFQCTASIAVGYIGVEEEIVRQLGRARDPARTVPPDEILYADVDALPTISITSHLAEGLRARRIRTRAQLGDIGRWLTFFILGAVGLSLGIAYLLTHLYRAQPFPEFIYYVTLQFIPRPLRGALFIVWGVGIIYLGLRSFYRSTRIGRRTHP